jgi:hypothetical protein
MRRRSACLALVFVALTQVSCDTSRGTLAPPTGPDVAPAELTAFTALTATGVVNTTLPVQFGARIGNKLGLPVRGATVTFRVATGGGTINPTTAVSDSLGRATTVWTLGPNAGPQTMTAIVGDIAPVTFTATATAAGVSAIAKTAGDAQSATVAKPVAAAPAVRLTDPNGNPVANVEVTFAIGSGDGSVTGASTRTGQDGIARAGSWTLGTKSGANTLRASAAGNLVATFTAQGLPDVPTAMTMATDETAELRVGSRFKATARAFDTYGNENTSAPISYFVFPPDVGSVDNAGNVTALAAGKLTVRASIGDSSGASIIASASHTTSVIGHPLGADVSKRLFIGADPSSVAVTDEGILGIAATGRVGLVTRLSLDGVAQFPSIGIQTAALNFLIVAPKRGGGTAIVTNIGAISSTYWFLDVKTNTVIDSITTTRYVQGAAMTADGSRAYFLLDAGELAVVDVATHQFLPSIPLGGGVTSFRAAAGDTIAFARSDVGTMLEIDLKNGRVRRQYPFPAYADVEPSRDLSQFYVIDAPAGLVRVLRASDLTQQFAYVTDATRIALPPDTKAMFLSIGDRVEVATGDVVGGFYPTARYVTSGVPSRVLFSTDGSVAVIPNANGWIDIVR